jgi:hypothetical protein
LSRCFLQGSKIYYYIQNKKEKNLISIPTTIANQSLSAAISELFGSYFTNQIGRLGTIDILTREHNWYLLLGNGTADV